MRGCLRHCWRGAGFRAALASALLAALPLVWLWGYTVDDALIIARVAAELASSGHYRFNPSGPAVDAVTPLGFPLLLVPAAHFGVLPAFFGAKLLGAAAWLMAAGLLGAHVQRAGRSRLRFTPLILLGCSAPLAAWAVAGMETGVVTLLGTLSVVLAPGPAAVCAGAAAGLRPELVPWALVIGVGLLAVPERPASFARALLFALGPALLVAVVRQLCFGRPLPLAVAAKPADFQKGAWYALEALLRTGPALLVIAPFALRALGRRERVVLLAVGAHVISIAAAGGDWMSLYRLIVPVLPGLIWLGSRVAEHARPSFTLLRTAGAVLLSLELMLRLGGVARAVGGHRLALIQAARTTLAGARAVAAVDAGWVGAATAAPIVDLAGVTDPKLALLPGSHTSKRIPPGLLSARGVDHLVLLLAPAEPLREPWHESYFARAVEQRLARSEADLGFAPEQSILLGGTSQRYIVLSRRAQPTD